MKSKYSKKSNFEETVHSRKNNEELVNLLTNFTTETKAEMPEDTSDNTKEAVAEDSDIKEVSINAEKIIKKEYTQKDTSIKNTKNDSHSIINLLNSKYKGCTITVMLKGVPGFITGEVVLNRDGVIALKHENIIVYINNQVISVFY